MSQSKAVSAQFAEALRPLAYGPHADAPLPKNGVVFLIFLTHIVDSCSLNTLLYSCISIGGFLADAMGGELWVQRV